MTELINRSYFKELTEQDPGAICQQAQCTYDAAKRLYSINIWGDEYRIYPDQNKVECVNGDAGRPHPFFSLFIVYYLLKAGEIETKNQWISEKDMPGGTTFFRGPHLIPTNLITARFENDIDAFKKRCEELNGTCLDMADAAYRFEITPCIPVAVLYWVGDEDFPAESKILYDQTITGHLTLDIIFALAVGICQRMQAI